MGFRGSRSQYAMPSLDSAPPFLCRSHKTSCTSGQLLLARRYDHLNRYRSQRAANEAARDRAGLPYVANDGRWDQIKASDAVVCGVKRYPTGARDENLRPSVCGPTAGRSYALLIWIIKVTRRDPHPKAKSARGFGKQNCQIAA